MTVDLDARISIALRDAADRASFDDGLDAILDRVAMPRSPRPAFVLAGTALALTAVLAAAVGAGMFDTSSSGLAPGLAVITAPVPGAGADCGSVESRSVQAGDERAVALGPRGVPAGYELRAAPSFTIQTRADSSVDCWTSEAVYLRGDELLTVTAIHEGTEVDECDLPTAQHLSCVKVAGQSGYLYDGGARQTIGWAAVDGVVLWVSGYGVDVDELVAIAATGSVEGDQVSLDVPEAWTAVRLSPKERSHGRTVVYYSAELRPEGDRGSRLGLTVTSWTNPSVNEVGPASVIDLGDTTAIVVTTGGPGTGLVQWRSDGDGEVAPVEGRAAAYATWSEDGRTFRVEGSDHHSVAELVRAVHAVHHGSPSSG